MVAQNGDGVRVVAGGTVVEARRVILAVPPALATRLAYSPALPKGKAKLLAALVPGSLTKADGGLRSALLARRRAERPGGGRRRAREHDLRQLAARRLGRRALRLRRRLGARAVGGRFRPTSAARRCSRTSPPSSATRRAAPVDYFEQDWTKERWTRGCPVAHVAPGVLTKYGPWLRRSVGKVHFAGTETADYWLGYMDGAVRSGERAAREVLAALRR